MSFFRMSRLGETDILDEECYYSCSELEGAVTLIHGAITMCGHVHSQNKGMPFACEYNGGEMPLDKLAIAREELRLKNQTEEDTPCKGCQFLQKRKWPKKKYLVDHITVGHYTPCNLACTYCYTTKYSEEEKRKYNTPPYNAAESIASIAAQNNLSPNCTAWLTAGEPTLFADFEEIVEVLLKNGVKTTIGTNCIKKPIDVVCKGVQENLIEILCSVDSGTKEKYQEIKGKDCHKIVWEHLGQYAAINPENIVVKYIFMDENSSEKEVREFISMCKSKAIRKISISRDILKYDGILSKMQENMPKEMFRLIALMMQLAIENDMEVFFDVNWPVFSDYELLKIRLACLEQFIKLGLSLDKDSFKLHFFDIVALLERACLESKF